MRDSMPSLHINIYILFAHKRAAGIFIPIRFPILRFFFSVTKANSLSKQYLHYSRLLRRVDPSLTVVRNYTVVLTGFYNAISPQ